MWLSPKIVSDKIIINVGGRTDIVNYYTPWLLNRLSEGYAYSRNPFARENVYKLSLKPEDVDCLLFCSKNYQPILKHIRWDRWKIQYTVQLHDYCLWQGCRT